MSFHSQQPGAAPKKDAPVVKPLDKKAQECESCAEDAVDTSEWSDEDEADINLAEQDDDPDAREDVEDKKLKSAKPAKQQ